MRLLKNSYCHPRPPCREAGVLLAGIQSLKTILKMDSRQEHAGMTIQGELVFQKSLYSFSFVNYNQRIGLMRETLYTQSQIRIDFKNENG